MIKAITVLFVLMIIGICGQAQAGGIPVYDRGAIIQQWALYTIAAACVVTAIAVCLIAAKKLKRD